MKTALTLLALLGSVHAYASVAKSTGVEFTCANADNTLKITANMSNDPQGHAVVVLEDDAPKLYSEFKNKKPNFVLKLDPAKDVKLQVRKTAKTPVLVSLDIDPNTTHVQLAHSEDGVTTSLFEAFLTSSDLQLAREPVKCTELKW